MWTLKLSIGSILSLSLFGLTAALANQVNHTQPQGNQTTGLPRGTETPVTNHPRNSTALGSPWNENVAHSVLSLVLLAALALIIIAIFKCLRAVCAETGDEEETDQDEDTSTSSVTYTDLPQTAVTGV